MILARHSPQRVDSWIPVPAQGEGNDHVSLGRFTGKAFMRTFIRTFVAHLIAVGLAGAAGIAFNATAQEFPTRAVHIKVGFPPGGTGDTLARLLGDKLAQMWRQPVLVENQTGATGMIALEAVARAKPDGYTLGMFSSGHIIAGVLIKPPFSLDADLTPIATIAQQAIVLVVNPALPVASVAELIEVAKSRRDN